MQFNVTISVFSGSPSLYRYEIQSGEFVQELRYYESSEQEGHPADTVIHFGSCEEMEDVGRAMIRAAELIKNNRNKRTNPIG